jgi:hypothetical protein
LNIKPSEAFGFLAEALCGGIRMSLHCTSTKLPRATMGVGMIQVDRRSAIQLRPEELALLKSCGAEIRKGDYRALELARSKRCPQSGRYDVQQGASLWYRSRAAEALRSLLKTAIERTRLMVKADANYLRRRADLTKLLP